MMLCRMEKQFIAQRCRAIESAKLSQQQKPSMRARPRVKGNPCVCMLDMLVYVSEHPLSLSSEHATVGQGMA